MISESYDEARSAILAEVLKKYDPAQPRDSRGQWTSGGGGGSGSSTAGWQPAAPGTPEHDRQLNELGGLAAGHSQEAAGAVDRARSAALQGRYAAAQGHLGNAAFLLHAAGSHNLAQAAEQARDSFTGAVPPARYPPGHGSFTAPAPSMPSLDFEAAMMMPRGVVPAGSRGGELPVTAPVRAKSLDLFGSYEDAKAEITAWLMS